MELAASLGSDVPLFLGPAACRMRGRGEILDPLDVHPFAAVLHLPAIHCPTGAVYGEYDQSPAEKIEQIPADVLRCPPSVWRSRLCNDLAGPAMRVQR